MVAHCHRRHKRVAHELSHFAHVKAIRFDIGAHRVCIGQCRRSPQQRRARSRGTSSSEIEVAQILAHVVFRMSEAGVCFCHLPRNMKSPNNSVTCRASHALSKLLLGAAAQIPVCVIEIAWTCRRANPSICARNELGLVWRT